MALAVAQGQPVVIPPFPRTNALGTVIPAQVCSMFAWDLQQIRNTIVQYVVQGGDAMFFVLVPGDLRPCKVVADRVRNAFSALVYWFDFLHAHGFCINGPLAACHFVLTFRGAVKGTIDLLDMLVQLDEGLRAQNMSWLADFARDHLYQTVQFGLVPWEVQHLMDILRNFAPDMYILVKFHPALGDAIEKSAVFTQQHAKLIDLKASSPYLYRQIIANISTNINNVSWICRAIDNLFLHQLLRFHSNTGSLRDKIKCFLSNAVMCGKGGVEQCLRVRRNGDSHLLKDYCGDRAGQGTLEAFNAALAAATVRIPALSNLPVNPLNFAALQQDLGPPFSAKEAEVIAIVITDALRRYRNSREQANAAARAAAMSVATRQFIYLRLAPAVAAFVVPNNVLPQDALAWQTNEQALYIQSYHLQLTDAAAAATAAAQQIQGPHHPVIGRSMFNVRDVANFFELMEPMLLSSLHRAMFDAHQLHGLQFHWAHEGVNLAV